MSEIVGVTADTVRMFYGNVFLPLLLSMEDRNMLRSKHNDLSDWIELKVLASSVTEVAKGRSRCWLMDQKTYSSALFSAGYAKKGLKPINLFTANEEMSKVFKAARKS